MPEPLPTTMKDIAEHFGVSIATVSRSLNGSDRVNAEKRRLICDYAHEHNFYPNDIAKSLRNSKRAPIKVIGVIVPEFAHYYFSTILNGIEAAATKRGFRIIATTSRESYENEVRICQMFEAHQVCGVIVSQAKETMKFDHFKSLVDRGIPIVFYDRICTGIEASLVVVDDYQGAFAATTYLVSTGCHRIAYYGMRGNTVLGRNRFNGYRDALIKAGIEPDPSLVYVCDNRDDAERITPDVLKRQDRPDGFFCVNDDTAIGVMYTAKHAGFNVPEDVSVCGFTNGQRSVACDPQLTTVEQRGEKVGEEAATILMNKVEGLSPKNKIEKKVVRTRLVVRGSTRGGKITNRQINKKPNNNETKTKSKFLELVEFKLRILRRTDSLRLAKCKHRAYIRNAWCRPAQLELFLDFASTHGHPCAAYNRYIKRPHMDSIWQTYTLSLYWGCRSCGCDVSVA